MILFTITVTSIPVPYLRAALWSRASATIIVNRIIYFFKSFLKNRNYSKFGIKIIHIYELTFRKAKTLYSLKASDN